MRRFDNTLSSHTPMEKYSAWLDIFISDPASRADSSNFEALPASAGGGSQNAKSEALGSCFLANLYCLSDRQRRLDSFGR